MSFNGGLRVEFAEHKKCVGSQLESYGYPIVAEIVSAGKNLEIFSIWDESFDELVYLFRLL